MLNQKISIFILVLILLPALALASELKGKISTDPKAPGGSQATSTLPQPPASSGKAKPSSSQGGGKPAGQIALKNNPAFGALKSGAGEVKVKGLAGLADGALVRDSAKRIYVVKNGAKKHLKTLAEIRKYGRMKILDLPDAELAQYPTQVFLDGELLRAKGQARIFAVENGRKKPVLSLDELAKNYAGVEIFNVEAGEMERYLEQSYYKE